MRELVQHHDHQAPRDEHRAADDQPVRHHQRRPVPGADQVGEDHQAAERQQDQQGDGQRREEDPAPVAIGALEVVGQPAERLLPWLEGARQKPRLLLVDRGGRDPVEHPALPQSGDQPRQAARTRGADRGCGLRQQLGDGVLPVQHLDQRCVFGLDRAKRVIAQVAQHPALVGVALDLLQGPAGPQPGTQSAVARHRGRGPQPKLGGIDRHDDRGVRPRGSTRPRRSTRRTAARRPATARSRGHRALHPQGDVPQLNDGAGGQPQGLGQRLAGHPHPEARSGIADDRALGRGVDPRVHPGHRAVLELDVRGVAPADGHRIADRQAHPVGKHQHERAGQRRVGWGRDVSHRAPAATPGGRRVVPAWSGSAGWRGRRP